MQNIIFFLLIALSIGCVHMRSMSTTSVPAERSKPVEAEGYRFLFLFINTNNQYINNLPKELAEQCPNGRVEGILTKHENIMYFPLFAHAVRVTASGFCIEIPDSTSPIPPTPDPNAEDPPPKAPSAEDAQP